MAGEAEGPGSSVLPTPLLLTTPPPMLMQPLVELAVAEVAGVVREEDEGHDIPSPPPTPPSPT
jgi:hypothetical protein